MIVQGIGDEVVGVLIVLFLVLLVSILWLSTHVQERPPVRAVVIRSANSETIAEFSAEPSPQVFNFLILFKPVNSFYVPFCEGGIICVGTALWPLHPEYSTVGAILTSCTSV